ncbi:MAG TPA: hypothetical protein VM187_03215, partial [Niastella sp.]|nr:hypothetical protein [Niastella sp.]
MKHISILIPHDSVLASIVDPRILFTGVNDFLDAVGKPPAFKVQLVGLTNAVQLHNGTFTVHADVLIGDVKKTDLILVPAIGGDLKTAIKKNE